MGTDTQSKEDESSWAAGWSPGCTVFPGRLISRKQVCNLQPLLEFRSCCYLQWLGSQAVSRFTANE